jgi:hypothetical protein
MGRVGLNVYPSEDFDFVELAELPDLILDLFAFIFQAVGCGVVTPHSDGRVTKAWITRRQSHTCGIRT